MVGEQPGQRGETSRCPRVGGRLRVETTRAPIQAAGDGGFAATPVRARPRALRYDFMPCLHPIQSNRNERPPNRAFASKRRGRYDRTLLRPGTAAFPVRAPRWPIPVAFANPRVGVRMRLVVIPCQTASNDFFQNPILHSPKFAQSASRAEVVRIDPCGESVLGPSLCSPLDEHLAALRVALAHDWKAKAHGGRATKIPCRQLVTLLHDFKCELRNS
jgi:hypothetical protein